MKNSLGIDATQVGFNLRYDWDDSLEHVGREGQFSQFTILFHSPQALRAMQLNPELGFGEGYMAGEIEVYGIDGQPADLRDVIRVYFGTSFTTRAKLRAWPSLGWWALKSWFNANTPSRARRQIPAHYDHPQELYSHMLDETGCYSCAYFARWGRESLAEAQRAKIDGACRKLDLQPDDDFLDVGCGRGALLFHAVEHYGVKGYGITLSPGQFEWVQREIVRRGLKDRCMIYLTDWRELRGLPSVFDKIASVGQFEHVGHWYGRKFCRAMYDRLADGGRFLLHTIVEHEPSPPSPFTMKYIFPGGEIPYDANVYRWLQRAGFYLRHDEYFGTYYHMTLSRWYDNFQCNWDKIRPHITGRDPEQFKRMWEFYLAGAQVSFEEDKLDLLQCLVTKGKPDRPIVGIF
ncbi:MAG: class I SAM-dependent methyltransferase [Candidatus Kerfeldbacteria bacterium]|nr:class I SAM-dependent methyltransferase [Candidatus Kerfeldbacteria bacterium]